MEYSAEYISKGEPRLKMLYSLTDTIDSGNSVITAINDTANSVSTILSIALGIIGICVISELRRKQINALFGYLTQLLVRLEIMRSYLENNKDEFCNRLTAFSARKLIRTEKITMEKEFANDFAEAANETLVFLKGTSEQMPASKKWPCQYRMLISFLHDAKKINNIEYYKYGTWEKSENFYNANKKI